MSKIPNESYILCQNIEKAPCIMDKLVTYSDIQTSSFFEVYEVNNEFMKIGKAKEVAEFLNIQLTRKNKTILENSFCTVNSLLSSNSTPIYTELYAA